MNEESVDPVRRLVADYHTLERALRGTVAAGARAIISFTEAHASLNLGGLAGHQILAAINAGNADVSDAMARIAAGHRMLEILGKSLGMDATAWGDGQKPPSSVSAALTEQAQ